MTDYYYINPDAASTGGAGTEEDPYKEWSEATIASDSNYYQKRGTSTLITSAINIHTKSDVNVDAYGSGNDPIIQSYSTITNSASFTEVQADNQTEVVTPGDTNVWKYNSGIESWNPHILLGLGSLGDRNGSSFTQRVNYLGSGTGSGTFTEFGQWEKNNGAAAPNEASLYIYADENPVDKWGTIYYALGLNPSMRVNGTSTDVSIKNIHFKYGYDAVEIGENTLTQSGVVVDSCISEHMYFGFRIGATSGTVTDSQMTNNKVYVAGNVGIRLGDGAYGAGVVISGNEIYDTGYMEGIGGIYGAPAGTNTIIEDNKVIGVTEGVYWAGEGMGLYSESETSGVTWRNNFVSGCENKAGMHINGGTSDLEYSGNMIVDCWAMLSGNDANGKQTDDYVVCNNTGINVTHGASLFRPSATGTMTATFKNNICYSDGTGGTGIRLDNDTDDMTNSFDEDYNCLYGFANTKTRTSGTLQQALGANNIVSDPLLNDISGGDYGLSVNSPALGIGKKWWTGANPIGYGGEPFSDFDIDLGGIMSLHGPFHPSSLSTQAAGFAAAPAWTVIPQQSWTTGDVINFNIREYVEYPALTTFEMDDTSEALPSALNDITVDGIITGTIASIQGGTYNLVFKATAPDGTVSLSSLSVVLVSLEIVDPILANLPDQGDKEEGALVTLNCAHSDYFTYDGNPAGVEVMTWSITSSGFTGDSINSVTGVYTNTIPSGTGLKTVVIRTTNSEGLYDEDDFTINVVALAGTVPLAAGLYTGNLDCNAVVVPTWIAGADEFFRAKSDTATTWSLDLNDYIASNGGAAITLWAATPNTFPTGVSLNTSTGVVSGSHDGTTHDPGLANTFVATNSAGASDSSPSYTWTVWDDTIVIPTITGITATDGTNTVKVNLSESCNTTADDAASYILGQVWKVNNAARNPTYVSGSGTTRLEFTLDGAVFSGNNTVGLVFTDALSDLKSSATGQQVADFTGDYVVPAPGSGVFLSDDFESYTGSITTGIWTRIGAAISLETTGGVDGGQHLLCSYAGRMTDPYEVSKDVSSLNLSEVYVKVAFKQNGTQSGSKFIKLFGKESDPEGAAGSTFSLDYIDNALERINYGPGETTQNDTQAFVRYDGLNTPDPLVNVVVAKGKYNTPINEWHTVQVFMKYNTNGNRDGEYKIWIDEVLWVHATNVKNRHDDNSMYFSHLDLANYTDDLPNYPDGVEWELRYDNVVMSTTFIDT